VREQLAKGVQAAVDVGNNKEIHKRFSTAISLWRCPKRLFYPFI
jgi:hypothetical protein